MAKRNAAKPKPLSKTFRKTLTAYNRTDKVQQKRLQKLQKEAAKKGYKLSY